MSVNNALSYFAGTTITSNSSTTQGGIGLSPGDGGHPTILKGPKTGNTSGQTFLYLPNGPGTNGQVLQTNGAKGELSWGTSATVGGSDTQIQYNSSGSLAGLSTFTTDGTDVTITADNQINFRDTGSIINSSGSGILDLVATTIAITGTATVSESLNPDIGDGATLGSATAEWSDLYLADGATIQLGNDQDVVLTHVADTGLSLESKTALTNTVIETLNLTHTTSGTPAAGIGADLAFTVETGIGNNEKGMILEALTTDVTSTSENFDFVVKLMEDGAAAAERLRVTSEGHLVPGAVNTGTIGTATAEWGDLYLGDSGVIYLGNDQDVTITHVADTGVRLNGSSQIQFRDADLYINSSADGALELATDELIYIKSHDTNLIGSNASIDIKGAVMLGDLRGVTDSNTMVAMVPQTFWVIDASTSNGLVVSSNTNIYIDLQDNTGSQEHAVEVQGSNATGQLLNLMFNNEGTNTVKLDFGNNLLVSGSGLARYLTFTNTGESASLVYIGNKWRIMNTGATVS